MRWRRERGEKYTKLMKLIKSFGLGPKRGDLPPEWLAGNSLIIANILFKKSYEKTRLNLPPINYNSLHN